MRKLLYIAIIFSLAACDKDSPEPDNNNGTTNEQLATVQPYIRLNYMEDARHIYLREILANPSHPNFNQAILDTNELNRFLSYLQAVYNLDTPQTDSIFEIKKIHAIQCQTLRSLSLNVDTAAPDIKNLVNGVRPTGNTVTENLLTTYQFDSITTAAGYPNNPWIYIYSKNAYNIKALVKPFADRPEIFSVPPPVINCVPGNDIVIKKTGNVTSVDFSEGTGSSKKHWKYTVENGVAKVDTLP